MSEVKTYRCNGPNCKNIKNDANHWFRAASTRPGYFIIARWSEDLILANGAEELHLCSESCAAKVMSKAIGAGVVEEDRIAE